MTSPLASYSFGELKAMVLKHTPLGEINLPSVASSANAPRCRRNRRFHTASAACTNFSGYAPLVRLHLAERLQVNLHLARLHELCRTLTNFAFSRSAKNKCRTFALCLRTFTGERPQKRVFLLQYPNFPLSLQDNSRERMRKCVSA